LIPPVPAAAAAQEPLLPPAPGVVPLALALMVPLIAALP